MFLEGSEVGDLDCICMRIASSTADSALICRPRYYIIQADKL